ncbi:MAG: hypothetical protein WA446_08575, partial [Steroidobacteraceae bacterium]
RVAVDQPRTCHWRRLHRRRHAEVGVRRLPPGEAMRVRDRSVAGRARGPGADVDSVCYSMLAPQARETQRWYRSIRADSFAG